MSLNKITKELDRKNTGELIKRLYKECQNASGYIGVEYDNLVIEEDDDDDYSLTENLFDKIMNEMVTLEGNPDEYIRSEFDEEAPFRNQRNVEQHIARLGKFVIKYAPIYLSKEKANSFVKDVQKHGIQK